MDNCVLDPIGPKIIYGEDMKYEETNISFKIVFYHNI